MINSVIREKNIVFSCLPTLDLFYCYTVHLSFREIRVVWNYWQMRAQQRSQNFLTTVQSTIPLPPEKIITFIVILTEMKCKTRHF